MNLFYFLILFSILSTASESLRDPTTPSGKTSSGFFLNGQTSQEFSAYTLSSLLISSTRRIAIINQKRVQEGELIDGKKVLKIAKEGVLIQGPGEQPRMLKMLTKEVRRP